MAGNPYLLAFAGAYLPADAVGIGYGYVKEVALSSCPVVGNGAFDHMAKVIELVAVLYLHPPFCTGPPVRMLRIPGPGGVEISVRLLGGGYNDKYAVDVCLQGRIGICLKKV